jgi:Mg-chelatase subunit ChlD
MSTAPPDPLARPPLVRWRLILGEAAQTGLGGPSLDADAMAADAALSWLYDREGELAERDVRSARGAGSDASKLTVPDWINQVHRLFPKETIERLERDAVERYQIHEVVTNPDVLRRVEPNMTLLQAVLRTKHLMNPEVLGLARELVARVVRDLMEKLAREVQASFGGTRDRRRWSAWKSARNFDPKRTIRHNLRHYSRDEQRLYIQRPLFLARTRRHSTRWQLIIVVDESGSMLSSVVHAAVTAACLWGLPALKTHLCIFDTEVVDLTDRVTDPVEALMKVQLGGGTDIAKAVGYAASLVENPRRTIVALITDFMEGGSSELLVRRVRALCEQGTQVLGLAALDEAATPAYDHEIARRLVDAGAHVGAMTPGQLAAWIAEKVRT